MINKCSNLIEIWRAHAGTSFRRKVPNPWPKCEWIHIARSPRTGELRHLLCDLHGFFQEFGGGKHLAKSAQPSGVSSTNAWGGEIAITCEFSSFSNQHDSTYLCLQYMFDFLCFCDVYDEHRNQHWISTYATLEHGMCKIFSRKYIWKLRRER